MKNLGKISEKFNAVKSAQEEYITKSLALQKQCYEFLKDLVDANGGEVIDENILEGTYVAYDGGNHPEYASTMASCVQRIYVENGKLYFDLEDEAQYSLDRVMIEDLVWVCNDIMNNIKELD